MAKQSEPRTVEVFGGVKPDAGYFDYLRKRVAHWDTVVREQRSQRGWGGYYHRRLTEIYRFIVGPGQKVLDLGCGDGNLLSALEPSVGVGVDFSDEALGGARERHPDLRFVHADVHELDLGDPLPRPHLW